MTEGMDPTKSQATPEGPVLSSDLSSERHGGDPDLDQLQATVAILGRHNADLQHLKTKLARIQAGDPGISEAEVQETVERITQVSAAVRKIITEDQQLGAAAKITRHSLATSKGHKAKIDQIARANPGLSEPTDTEPTSDVNEDGWVDCRSDTTATTATLRSDTTQGGDQATMLLGTNTTAPGEAEPEVASNASVPAFRGSLQVIEDDSGEVGSMSTAVGKGRQVLFKEDQTLSRQIFSRQPPTGTSRSPSHADDAIKVWFLQA